MKTHMTILMAVLVIAAPMMVQNAHAQLEIGIGGGFNSPLGEFGDQADTGYSITSSLGFRPAPFLVLGAEVSWYGNNASDDFLQGAGPGVDMSTNIQQYAGMAKLLLPVGNHNVFAKGLVGSYAASAKVTSPLGEQKVNNTDPGFGLGGGVLINGDKNSSFFLDVTYHNVKYDGADSATNFVTTSFGAVFGFSLFN